MNRRFTSVFVNEIQGNPFQPDINYRGYTASPLLGTPQGLSVYVDGVRLNQPFGDIVSWDLIPRAAIASTTLIPGSNPLFGLNTLGGALSVQTKNGRSDPGTSVQAFTAVMRGAPSNSSTAVHEAAERWTGTCPATSSMRMAGATIALRTWGKSSASSAGSVRGPMRA